MLHLLFTIFLTYLVTTFFGYVVHWAFHQKWTGPVNKAHMTHHLKLYPADDYLSDVYRQPGKDNTVKLFAFAAIIPVGLLFLSFFLGFMSLSTLIVVCITLAILGFLHDYLHDSFHIRNHWLTKLPIINKLFGRWNELHYLHHVDMQKNFGIFSFHWDRVFKTFWSK